MEAPRWSCATLRPAGVRAGPRTGGLLRRSTPAAGCQSWQRLEEVTSLTELAAGENSHRWPQILTGSKAVVFTVGSVPGNYASASIAVASLEGNRERAKRIVLSNVGMSPHYLSTGHLVYVANGTLYAVQFDVDSLEVRAPPCPCWRISRQPPR